MIEMLNRSRTKIFNLLSEIFISKRSNVVRHVSLRHRVLNLDAIRLSNDPGRDHYNGDYVSDHLCDRMLIML